MPTPSPETVRAAFPVGPYTFKCHGAQFDMVCDAIGLLEGLLTASEDKKSVDVFNSVVDAASKLASARHTDGAPALPDLPPDAPAELRELLAKLAEQPQITRVDMATAQDALDGDDLRRFVTVDFFTDIGATLQRAFGPAGLALSQLGGPNILAGAVVASVARTLPHYIVNKDMMDATKVDFNPNIYVKWSVNVKKRTVEIKGYYGEDDSSEADAGEG